MTRLPHYVFRKVSARQFLITAAILSVSTLIQYVLWPYLQPLAYLIYYPAIVVCAFYGDGLLATIGAILIAQILFIEPRWEWSFHWSEDGPRMFTFGFSGVVISALVNELRADRNRLVEEQQLRERLVSLIAHDLRNPLTAARLGIDRTLHAWPPTNQQPLLRSLDSLTRADHLVANILDASRIAAGEPMPVQKAPTNVNALVRKTLSDAELTHGNRFRLEAADGEIEAQIDPEAFQRVVENLVNNAVKYGDPSSPVVVRLGVADGSMRTSVINQGTPLPAEVRSQLFQPFRRGGRMDVAGWGLGLAAVKGIVEAHGGSIRVESSRETGTCFQVTVPLSV